MTTKTTTKHNECGPGSILSIILCLFIIFPSMVGLTGNGENDDPGDPSRDKSREITCFWPNSRADVINQNNVLINEFMADPGMDYNGDGISDVYDEYIELFNPTEESVDLDGYGLDDIEGGGSSIYVITGVTLAPGAHGVFFRNQTGIALNNNGLERVRLLDGNGEDVDNFTYNNARSDRCWNRRGDANETWTMPRLNTPGLPNPGIPLTVINEFVPVPDTISTDEWVEIYNAGKGMINMTGWTLGDMDSNEFVFPFFVLDPGEYVVVVVGGPGSFRDDDSILYMESSSQMLTNTGDDILLCDDVGVAVDYASYGNGSSVDGCPPPLSFNGTAHIPTKGVALALLPNGKLTGQGCDFFLRAEENITMGWNNSEPISLVIPEVEGFEVPFSGTVVNIVIRNRCFSPSAWNVAIHQTTDEWTFDHISLFTLGPLEKRDLSIEVTFPPSLLPGTGIEVKLNLTSADVGYIRYNSTLIFSLPANVVINEIMVDAHGADSENDEWLELLNREEVCVNISGWKIFSGAIDGEIFHEDPLFTFPGLTISPGAVILIHTQDVSESNFSLSAIHFYISGNNVWTNTKGSVSLITSAFTGVDFLRWGETGDLPVFPDFFQGNLSAPSSGKTLSRHWFRPDSDNASDFFIPTSVNQTPGLPNGNIHSYRLSSLPSTSVLAPDSTEEYILSIENTGNRSTNFSIDIDCLVVYANGVVGDMVAENHDGWRVEFTLFTGPLESNDIKSLSMFITSPGIKCTGTSGDIVGVRLMVNITPFEDPWRRTSNSYFFQHPIIDLAVSRLYLADDWEGLSVVPQGELLGVKAQICNFGPINATDVDVFLFVDEMSKENIVDVVHYTSVPGTIWGTSRNPSFTLDTLLYPGVHKFIMAVNSSDYLVDCYTQNDVMNFSLNITPLAIAPGTDAVLITQAYYYSYLDDEGDEFVKIYNQGNVSVDISGWQLTDDVTNEMSDSVAFPPGTLLPPFGSMLVARNSDALLDTSGKIAQLDATQNGVPDMICLDIDWPNFHDYSGQIVLRTEDRWVVDMMVYGKMTMERYGWTGAGVPRVSRGYYASRRTQGENNYVDTNSSSDFNTFRQYCVGGSELSLLSTIEGAEVFFLPISPAPFCSMLEWAMENITIVTERFTSNVLFEYIFAALGRGVEVNILLEGHPWGGIDDIQKYYTYLLSEKGANILFMDHDPGQKKYARYETVGMNGIVVDGRHAVLQSVPFTEDGLRSEHRPDGAKGMGLVLHGEAVSHIARVFEQDINVSRRDITGFDNNHSRFGGPAQNHMFTDDGSFPEFMPSHTIKYDAEYLELGIYPDNSASMGVSGNGEGRGGGALDNRSGSMEEDVLVRAFNDAEENLYIVTEELSPLVDELELDGTVLLPHMSSIFNAAESGVSVKILLDISQDEMLFNELEKDVYGEFIPGEKMDSHRHIATWVMSLALERGISNIEIRYDYLENETQVEGTLVLVDGVEMVATSASLTYRDLYLNRHWGARVMGPDICASKSIFENWWERAIPMETDVPSSVPILITEVYYDSLASYRPDQYVKIFNPSSIVVDLGYWRLTDKHSLLNGFEGTAIIPRGTFIGVDQTLVLAREAIAYETLTSHLPDLEYGVGTADSVPDMMCVNGEPSFTDRADEVFLVDRNGSLVDGVIFGESLYSGDGWNGVPATGVNSGNVLVRKRDDSGYVDTNTSVDFNHSRPYRPGQSSFKLQDFPITENVTCFVSPDTSFGEVSRALSTARNTLLINVYQFHHPYLLDMVVNLSRGGVEVKVLLEGGPVGGITDNQRHVSQKLNASGVHVRYMISDRAKGIGSRYTYNHAKYLVIDNCTLVLLSENLKISGVPVNTTYGNRGWGISVQDEDLSKYFSDVFHHDFNPQMSDSIRYDDEHDIYGKPPDDMDMNYNVRTGSYLPRFPSFTQKGCATIRPVLSPDTSSSVQGSIISLLEGAKKTIRVEQLDVNMDWGGHWAYNWSSPETYYLEWSDGDGGMNLYLRSLIDAARRGVKVQVLLDSAFVWSWSTHRDNQDTVNYINRVAHLEGIDIEATLVALGGVSGKAALEKVHNKGVIVDEEMVLISSINWGKTSVLENREAGLMVNSTAIAGYYADVFDFDWALSVFNYISPHVIYSANRTISPGSATHMRLALTYLNVTIPSTLTFSVTVVGPLNVTLSPQELRIYPGETRELSLLLRAVDNAKPGVHCKVVVEASLMNHSVDFLFLELEIAEKGVKQTQSGTADIFATLKNILSVLLVALVVLLFALARDVIFGLSRYKDNKDISVRVDSPNEEDMITRSAEVEVMGDVEGPIVKNNNQID